MFDLNNVLSGALLCMNTPGSIELETPSELSKKGAEPDDQTLDASAFVFLFAQVLSSALPAEVSENPHPETVNITVASPEIKTSSIDENVAVAWINSPYYQAGSVLDAGAAATTDMENLKAAPAKPEEQSPLVSYPLASEEDNPVFSSLELGNEALAQLTGESAAVLAQDAFEMPQAASQTTYPLASEVSFLEIKKQVSASEPSRTDFNNPLEFVVEQGSAQNASNLKEPVPEKIFNKVDFDSGKDSLAVQRRTAPNPGVGPSKPFLEDGRQVDFSDAVPTNEQQNSLINSLSQSGYSSSVSVGENPSDTAVPLSLTLNEHVESQQWAKEFSEHVTWLGQQSVKSALIKLNPEELGPLEIHIKVINDSASLNIISHSAEVREIIDQSLPKLQEMMVDQGLNLGDVHIDSEQGSRQFGQQNQHFTEDVVFTEAEKEESLVPVKNKPASQGVIDYFA